MFLQVISMIKKTFSLKYFLNTSKKTDEMLRTKEVCRQCTVHLEVGEPEARVKLRQRRMIVQMLAYVWNSGLCQWKLEDFFFVVLCWFFPFHRKRQNKANSCIFFIRIETIKMTSVQKKFFFGTNSRWRIYS